MELNNAINSSVTEKKYPLAIEYVTRAAPYPRNIINKTNTDKIANAYGKIQTTVADSFCLNKFL